VSNCEFVFVFFFFSSRRRHTRSDRDWSSDVCSSDLERHPRVTDLLALSPLRIVATTQGGVLVSPDGGRTWSQGQLDGEVRALVRSEERRVGKECRSRGAA